MSLNLAPYNDAMRLGQGFNSYTQELCIDNAVNVKANDVRSVKSPSQVVSYSARLVESLGDVLEGLNLSFSSSIKKGTVELSGSSTTVNENSFKSSDINAVVSVKVTNQVTTVDESAEYELMASAPPGTAAFDEAYGDSYISGFITGGEFTGIISIKVIDRSNVRSVVNKIRSALAATPAKDELTFGPVDAALGSTFSSTLSSTETTISVAWMGGGEIKDPSVSWSLDSIMAAAAAFPSRVAERPQRTFAILTKYKANKSFMRVAQGNVARLLEYDQVKSYTAQLFEHYMDYKLLLRQLQIIIKDSSQFETQYGLVNALDTSLETLLSIKTVFRAEQAKIVRAVDYLSKNPASIQGRTPVSNLRLAKNVRTILDQLLPSQSSSILGAISTTSLTPADATTTTNEKETEKAFDFASLIPPEVWSNVMPVPKKGGKYSSQPAAISLGDFKLPLTPEAALNNAQPTSAPQSSMLPQLEDAKRYQELQDQVRKEREAKETATKEKDAVGAKLTEANGKITAKDGEIKSLQQQNEAKANEIKALESKVTEAKVARADEIKTHQETAATAQRSLTEALAAAKADDGRSWKDKYTSATTDLASRNTELQKTKTDLVAAEQALKAPDGQTWKQKSERAEQEKLASFSEAQDLKNRRLPNEDEKTENNLWIIIAHYGGTDYSDNANVRRNIRECLDKKSKVSNPFSVAMGFVVAAAGGASGGTKTWSQVFDNKDPLPNNQKTVCIAYRWNKQGHINIINSQEYGEYQF